MLPPETITTLLIGYTPDKERVSPMLKRKKKNHDVHTIEYGRKGNDSKNHYMKKQAAEFCVCYHLYEMKKRNVSVSACLCVLTNTEYSRRTQKELETVVASG